MSTGIPRGHNVDCNTFEWLINVLLTPLVDNCVRVRACGFECARVCWVLGYLSLFMFVLLCVCVCEQVCICVCVCVSACAKTAGYSTGYIS